MGMESPQSQTVRAGQIPHRWTRVEDPGAESVVAAFETVIAGGGPAGLTGAYELTRHGRACVVLEADPRLVGGISRTDEYKGYRFDIGGHRFFSKSSEINALWREILGGEFITRSRLSRIYYDRKFFHYPLKPVDALWKLGPWRSARILLSYMKARARPDPARADVRGLGRQSVRPGALRDLLQVVHREALGHAHQRDLGRLGGPADQGLEPGRGRGQRPVRGAQVAQGRGDQDPDRRVSVSAARSRPDVGSGARPHPRAGRGGAPRPQGRADRARRIGRHGLRRRGFRRGG